MTKRNIGIALAVLIALIAFMVIRSGSEEAAIRRTLSKLDKALDQPGEEGLVNSISAARTISKFFTEDAELDIGPPMHVLKGRAEFSSSMVHVRQQAQFIKVTIQGMEVTLSEEIPSAAKVALVLEGQIKVPGENASEFREYDLLMTKVDGDWLIDRVEQDVAITDPSKLK